MRSAFVLAEGKDDLRALREILQRDMGFRVVRADPIPGFKIQERLVHRQGGQVHIVNAGSREQVFKVAREKILEAWLPEHGYDSLGLLFDPEEDSDEQWQSWLKKEVLSPSIAFQEQAWGYQVSIPVSSLGIVPLPWDAGTPFDEAEPANKRSLERVSLAILQSADSREAALLLRMLDLLRIEGRKVSWKTAFRLFNAVRHPETEEGFVAQVFGQDSELRPAVSTVLKSTSFWRRLEVLVRGDAPSP